MKKLFLSVLLACQALHGASISLLLNSGTHQLSSPLDAWTVNGANIYNAMGLGGMSLQLPGSVNITGGTIAGVTYNGLTFTGTGGSTVDFGTGGVVNYGGGGGGGTVTDVSVVTVGPISGSVANSTTTPAISLTLAPITEALMSLSDVTTLNATTLRHGFVPKLINDPTKFLDSQGNFTVPPGQSTGSVTTVSVTTQNGVSGVVTDPTGAPAIALTLGAITPSTVNGNTITTGSGTLTLGAGKTATINNTLTFTGTDSTSMDFPATSASIARIDAAQTFAGVQTFGGQMVNSLAGAASTPMLTLTGATFTGGSGTTTKPSFLVEPTGTASTVWATTGTLIGANANAGTPNLIDLQTSGASQFKISNVGNITSTASAFFGNTSIIGWTARSRMTSPADGTILLANTGSATFTSLQLGPDVAAPSNVSIEAGSGVGADKNGGNLTYDAGNNTGAGTGGSHIFRTAPVAASSSTAGTLTTALTIDGTGLSTFAGFVRFKPYTVATLPAAGTAGRWAYVSDATAPTYNGALTGGGAVTVPVFDNGTIWTSH